MKYGISGTVITAMICQMANADALLIDAYGNANPQSYSNWVDAGVAEDIALGAGGSMVSGGSVYNISGMTGSITGASGAYYGGVPGNDLLNDYIFVNSGTVSVSIGGFEDGTFTSSLEGMSGNTFTLQPDTDYKLYLFGAGDSDGQDAAFTFDGVSKTTSSVIAGADEDSHYVSYEFTTPTNITGYTLDFTYSNNSSDYGAWNGLALVDMTPFSVDTDAISMDLEFPNTTVTGSVDVSSSGTTNVEVSVSVSDESHAGAFSVLTSTPLMLGGSVPSNAVLDIQFDNDAAGLAEGESATGTVSVVWNIAGDADTTEVEVPFIVEYAETVIRQKLIQVDFGSTDGDNGTTAEDGTFWNGVEPGGNYDDLAAGGSYIVNNLVDELRYTTMVSLTLDWSGESGHERSSPWDLHPGDRDGDYLGIQVSASNVYNTATFSGLTEGALYDVTVWSQAQTDFRANGGDVRVVYGAENSSASNEAMSYTFEDVAADSSGEIAIDWGYITSDPDGTTWATLTAVSIKPSKPQAMMYFSARQWLPMNCTTLDSIDDYTVNPENLELSKYGGWKARRYDEGTGFFRVEQIDGRWWAIDPEGYLYIHKALCTVNADVYTPDEVHTLLTTNGFNGIGNWSDIEEVIGNSYQEDEPLAYCPTFSFMGTYRNVRQERTGEETRLNMPVFDEEFEEFCNEYADSAYGAYADDPHVFGLFSDNELSWVASGGLIYHLAIEDTNDLNYIEAWDFIEGLGYTSTNEVTYQDRLDYTELMAERYYSVVSAAIHSVDTNHLYIGSRVNKSFNETEDFFRAQGKYVDVVSINAYHRWGARLVEMQNMSEWAGRPMMATEYYAMEDDPDVDEEGAGFTVYDQESRGLFYQNFLTSFADTKVMVGWHWFKYQAFGTGNKGILDTDGSLFTTLLADMQQMNTHLYDYIDYSDSIDPYDLELEPEADAFFKGDENYGTNDYFQVNWTENTAYLRQAYLRFDLSDIEQEVESATIIIRSIHNTQECSEYRADLVTDDSWDELTITAYNCPDGSTSLGTWGDAGDIVLDVTEEVLDALKDNGKISIRITSALKDSQLPTYASSEHANPDARPKLCVNYVSPREPAYAEWTLDDAGGTAAADSSGNGFDGTVSSADWVMGVDGSALAFDGSSSRVDLPAEAFDTISNEVSIAMWVYGDSSQPSEDVLFRAVNSAGDRVLNIHLPWSNSTVYWDAGDDAGDYDRVQKEAASDLFKDSWNHWVFSKNSSTGVMKIYVNGVLWLSESGNTKSMAGISAAVLGGDVSGSTYSGMVDEVLLYDRALTDDEVAVLYSTYPLNGAGTYGSGLDIGYPSLSGSSSYSNGIYTVTGGGADISGTADQFYYVYDDHSGDGEITAQVTSVEDTDTWAKGGVMFRESLAAGSVEVMVGVRPDTRAFMQYRDTTNGETVSMDLVGGTDSIKWIRLLRSGDEFTGYRSTDGYAWNPIATITVNMDTNVLKGLAVTAHNDADLCTATFNMVPPAPSGVTAESVGADQVDLAWDSAFCATAYSVKRSTVSGGTYAEAGQAASTNYSDTGLSAGTNYYYVVCGEYFGVEGDSSAEVSAIPSALIDPDAVMLTSAGITVDGTSFALSVTNSYLGHNYRVWVADDLVDPDWQDASGTLTGNGGLLEIDVPIDSGITNQFYKLETWRQ